MHGSHATTAATTITQCRACRSSALVPLFSLGDLALCNAFVSSAEEEIRIPLELMLCSPRDHGCGLVQLRHTTAPELMYTQYWYKSGLSSTMRAHLEALVHQAEDLVPLAADDIVLDIGCNDGTTLRGYRPARVRRVGFEPSQLYREAEHGTTAIVHDVFSRDAFRAVAGAAQAKIVTSLAMFYDLDDSDRFIGDVRECLAPGGVWIIEMHYLPSMLESNGFDAIIHEHVAYYSLRTLQRLLARHALVVFDVERNPMNGGSFRVFIRHADDRGPASRGAAARVRRREASEDRLQLDDPETYRRFWTRINRVKRQAQTFLRREAAEGRRVYVYGASTKGNALLQFFGLDASLIAAAADKNPDKWGRRMPGSLIPIVSPEDAARANPDALLVLIWHLLDEVRAQWAAYLAAGGRLLVPLPRFRVVAS